jgi:outer membrane protein
MMSKKLFLIALALTTLVASAFAQDSKIGFINAQRIKTDSTIAKAAGVRLEQEFTRRRKDLGDMQASMKTFSEKFERDAPTMTESQRGSRQKEYAELNRDFQRKQREYNEDLAGRQNEEMQQLIEKTIKAVRVVAEAEKYDLVIEEGVVYSNSKHDITEKVLKILNAGAK